VRSSRHNPPWPAASQTYSPPSGETITRKAFKAPKGAIITRKAYKPPSRRAGYLPSVMIRYPYPLLLTLLKTRKNKEKKGKKREKKGSNRCNRYNRCLKRFAEKIPRKTVIFTPQICYIRYNLLLFQEQLQSSVRTNLIELSHPIPLTFAVNLSLVVAKPGLPHSVNCINDRNALPQQVKPLCYPSRSATL
jgi:hypothetical protein